MAERLKRVAPRRLETSRPLARGFLLPGQLRMYYPTLAEIRQLRKYGNLIPVWCEIGADLETPVSAYLKVARGEYSFLLESVEGGEHLARYSFIGTEPALVLRSRKEKPADPLRLAEAVFRRFRPVTIPGLPRFHGGIVGYLSYEVARYFESLPVPEKDPQGLPESVLMLADSLLVFDHVTHTIKVVSHAYIDDDVDRAYGKAVTRIDELVKRLQGSTASGKTFRAAAPKHKASSNFSQTEFEAMVSKAKEYIHSGDVIQVVLSLRLERPTGANPFTVYRALRSVNPSPYMYYLHLGDFHIAGASPELLVRVEKGMVSTHPIAGTRRRGKNSAEDAALEQELRHDAKECAEHIMLVDLGRNDIGRVSEPGTVKVTQLMDVERYSHVMHLVSHVQGRLRAGLSQFDALRSCFPAGTVSGAPKIRAMEIIAELERERRGPYAGAVGYFDFSGNLDTAIAIRTIVIKDGIAYMQAGAGIVADSVPELEYQESLNKAQALLTAIDKAEVEDYASVSSHWEPSPI